MSDLGKRLLTALGLTIAADTFLFAATPGLGLALFALLTGLVLCTRTFEKLPRARLWLALWVALALNTAWVNSLIGTLLLITLTWVILALALMPEPASFFTGVVRGLTGGARSYTLLGSDLRRYALITNRILDRRGAREGGLFKFLPPFWVIALPALLIFVFAILIVPANLVLAQWAGDAASWLWDELTAVFIHFDIVRILFWIGMGLGLYGLLRFRLGRRPGHWSSHSARIRATRMRMENPSELLFPNAHQPEMAPPDTANPRHELQACLITFVGLNVLYLLANITDIFYIWLHFELPAGMTYAAFAHHGSYRLIVAVVLAAILVPAFYRIGVSAATHPRARTLAYLFVAQNLCVLLGAARRLMLYDEIYGLSRFRLSTYLWLALVF
ncbi:MAG TPA: DUF4153 domain-containing protein, partial [Planctomycetota bacterium]|nr:DUF4153 domain-containing protein [Planctomycetota bacterium]